MSVLLSLAAVAPMLVGALWLLALDAYEQHQRRKAQR